MGKVTVLVTGASGLIKGGILAMRWNKASAGQAGLGSASIINIFSVLLDL